MMAQEPAMTMVNQMTFLSGQSNRLSFHMEINAKTTRVMPRITINHRLKFIVSASYTVQLELSVAFPSKTLRVLLQDGDSFYDGEPRL
jgi:hypothetical protein